MDHSTETRAEPISGVAHEEIVTNLDRPPLLSWGAILGGLVFVVAVSWLLNLLGLAIGASVADASDGEAMANGLTTGAVVWMVLSWLVAFFVGSLLTARLSGKVDSTVGMLHGMTLWGLATSLMLVLGYWGVSGLIQTGFSLTKTAAATAASATSSVGGAVSSTTAALDNAADSRIGDNIKARLKRRAASVVSRLEAEGGTDVTAEEVEQAISDLDSTTVQDIATKIAMGEMTAAREELAAETELEEEDTREIVAGIEREFEEQLGTADNDAGLVTDISRTLKSQLSDFVASLDAAGGADVSQSDIRDALRQMDRETMQVVANRLMNGDAAGAKDALAANTNLTTRQINDIVDGVNDDVSRSVEKYLNEANEAVEAASTYAQAVLWSIFVAAAMGLAVSLFGGWLGAESSRNIEVEVQRRLA